MTRMYFFLSSLIEKKSFRCNERNKMVFAVCSCNLKFYLKESWKLIFLLLIAVLSPTPTLMRRLKTSECLLFCF